MAELPMPKLAPAQRPFYRNGESNTGLWFERFFKYPERSWDLTEPEAKNKWLAQYFDDRSLDGAQLDAKNQATAQRQIQLVSDLKGRSLIFKLSSPLITGMGNSHPLENGLLWHHTSGLPFITGSTIKGALRAYIEQHLELDSPENRQLLFQLFGSNYKFPDYVDETGTKQFHDDYDTQTGELIFFDALPVEPVKLGLEIMTPHMGDWYAKGDDIASLAPKEKHDAIPADWHSPIPIKYLAVQEASFLFSFAPRSQHNPLPLDTILDLLSRALASGIGAKTSSGYGRMMPVSNHPLITSSLSGEDWVRNFLDMQETTLAKRFLGKKFDETLKEAQDAGLDKATFLQLIKELYQPQLEGWKDHSKKDFKRAYKTIYKE